VSDWLVGADVTDVAENTGISLQTLVKGVVQLETLMENWNLADRKRRLLAEQQSVSSSDDED